VQGGEKQRVSIARTLLKNPPIIVLDEATSALDTRTEAEVQGAINTALTGRTAIIIAHRLSTIRTADQIIVLRDGQVLEQGTHADLLSKGGEYADMWNQQLRRDDEAVEVKVDQ
jgi:ABC-type transport system involved in Fe-S cluster assembly fused permease/ATPase subunit